MSVRVKKKKKLINFYQKYEMKTTNQKLNQCIILNNNIINKILLTTNQIASFLEKIH